MATVKMFSNWNNEENFKKFHCTYLKKVDIITTEEKYKNSYSFQVKHYKVNGTARRLIIVFAIIQIRS